MDSRTRAGLVVSREFAIKDILPSSSLAISLIRRPPAGPWPPSRVKWGRSSILAPGGWGSTSWLVPGSPAAPAPASALAMWAMPLGREAKLWYRLNAGTVLSGVGEKYRPHYRAVTSQFLRCPDREKT